jgi:hypothetical protein
MLKSMPLKGAFNENLYAVPSNPDKFNSTGKESLT